MMLTPLAPKLCSTPTSMLDAPPLAGGTTTAGADVGSSTIEVTPQAAPSDVVSLVAITSTKRRLHLRNTATSDDEPITHALGRHMCLPSAASEFFLLTRASQYVRARTRATIFFCLVRVTVCCRAIQQLLPVHTRGKEARCHRKARRSAAKIFAATQFVMPSAQFSALIDGLSLFWKE